MIDTRNVSLRVDRNVLSIIEQESQRLQINLNNMANQIFRSYTDWDMLQARAGMIPIAKPLLSQVLAADIDIFNDIKYIYKIWEHHILMNRG